jgi:hypothetical protein
MAIIQTTSRQFREKQKDFFDLAEKWKKINLLTIYDLQFVFYLGPKYLLLRQ